MVQDWKDTLQLPKTDFPMRANLAQREPGRVAHWNRLGPGGLYAAIQARRDRAPAFVLHDGPPFTNGDVHIGTALNKTLKDIIVRFKSLRGLRAPYLPGWDCHGLPIEQKVGRELQEQKREASVAELRQRCDAFSESWIAKQEAQFRRLGVLGDWEHAYRTKDPAYEADILRTFAAFVDQGLVYRSKKPVYWSIPFETALAEAEVEYKDHVSPSIWVRFPVPAAEAARFGLPADRPLSVLIWTTTPWTIPANLALAVHPELQYVVIAGQGEYLLCARERAPHVIPVAERAGQAAAGRAGGAAAHDPAPATAEFAVAGPRTWSGRELEGLTARHPFIERASPVVLADYVTTESGTGVVHTAPGHGAEDYLTGLKYQLEIYCPVGDDGKYLDDGRLPKELVGLTTLETVEDLEQKRTSPANVVVLRKLDAAGALLAREKYTHSYPHCWRSKTPIIFRAVDQWFVALDGKPGAGSDAPAASQAAAAPVQRSPFPATSGTASPRAPNSPRQSALAAIAQVEWIPDWGRARIESAVASRPDWCISRQRAWGVPIPAFYGPDKGAYLDANVIRAIAERIAVHGSNLWYESTAAELLAGVPLPAGWPAPAELARGRDTLDVWIDSGSSHAAVLARQTGGTHWPADLYLEGSDQHRGWFQSSLWTSVIARGGRAPYRAVLTHGFIVDEERRKISKSSAYEKPQTSDAYIAAHGADVIRLWIASQNFRDDIPISREILAHVGETYKLVRNTFRYQLANLHDFDPRTDLLAHDQLDTLDRWVLHRAAELVRACAEAYDASEFHQVYQLCNQFCAVTLSATYHDIIKDRMYTLATRHPLRRSSQTALHHVFHALAGVLAPILVFTTDEAWSFATARSEYADGSIHLQDWPAPPAEWTDAGVDAEVEALLRVRARVNEALEPLRAAGRIGKSLDAALTLAGDPASAGFRNLEKHRDFLPELFIVSHVMLQSGTGRPVAGSGAGGAESLAVSARPAAEGGFCRCPRCWRWVPTLESTDRGDVCPRCREALAGPP